MPKTTNTIFIEKGKLEKDFQNFLENRKVKYLTILEEAFNDVEELLKSNRFIPMNNGYCYDKNINSCWLGLCKENFKYIDGFNSGAVYQDVLKRLRKFYKNENIDIPTKSELRALTNITEAPFSLYRERPNSTSCYILYKSGSYVNTYDMDSNHLCDVFRMGSIHPIYRLHKTSENLVDKEHFLLWIEHKLKPDGLYSKAYDSILEIGFDISGNLDFINIDYDAILDKLLKADKIRANIVEYKKELLTDLNKGSWEAFCITKKENFKEPVPIKLDTPIVVKNPKKSIVNGGIVGIDFGTKSTVVVYQKDNESITPLYFGIRDWNKKRKKEDYENPTIMEFINLDSFLKKYKKSQFRPKTKWIDLTVSHTAYENFQNKHYDNFDAYLSGLKQWAGGKKRKINIKDMKGKDFELKEFKKIGKNDLNPIELYAYYLGLYINNQNQDGIYLEYLLSFPATYNCDSEIREKILESFKKGIKKSLPNIGNRVSDLRVRFTVNEPTAYASVALQEYGLAEESEKNFYGVFDFGGGTTDFDFGIFRWSDENKKEEDRYDYVIEHFEAGGDKYLGGENLLELLAFEVFKKNKNILIEQEISFSKPLEFEGEDSSRNESLLSNSKEAKLNMINLMQKLRDFWEREDFEKNLFNNEISIDLYNKNGKRVAEVELEIDENELKKVLIKRVQKGVDSFFKTLSKVLYEYRDNIDSDIETINIFLAGNSSKSPIVKELFKNRVKSEIKDNKFGLNLKEFKIFEPLDNKNDFTKPNGKTGVAFGIIETRHRGNILVIDKNIKNGNIKFNYYLGKNRRKRFKVIIDRDIKYSSDKWHRFINAMDDFEIFYTDSSSVVSNKSKISDKSIRKITIYLNQEQKSVDKSVYIRLLSPNSFEYGVGESEFSVETIGKIEF